MLKLKCGAVRDGKHIQLQGRSSHEADFGPRLTFLKKNAPGNA